MLKQETIIVNGCELIKTYSDKNLYIKKLERMKNIVKQ